MSVREQELVSSRGKAAIGLLGCLVFVAIFSWAWLSGDTDWKLKAGGLFFASCAMAFVVLIARPQRLKLDAAGFTLSGGFMRAPKKIAWSDVGEFYVKPLSRGATIAAFTYAEGAEVPFKGVLGRSGGIPGVWQGGPAGIVWQLNRYRDDALRQ